MVSGDQVVAGLVAFSLLKKATAYGIARYYGFPRIYRKILRFNLRLSPTPVQHNQVKEATKSLFRWPNRVADNVRGYVRNRVLGRGSVQGRIGGGGN